HPSCRKRRGERSLMTALAVHGNSGKRAEKLRRLYMVLSPNALLYASLALKSLFSNAGELIHLSLITDSESDKERLSAELSALKNFGGGADRRSVFSAADLDEREDVQFAKFKHLRSFRRGHPCWRKVTDPLLLAEAGQEMILLDPDLYFPNRFRFEPTP